MRQRGARSSFRSAKRPATRRYFSAGRSCHGQTGRYLCPLTQAFGIRVLVSDPYVRVVLPGITQVELPQLMAEADQVVSSAM